jgi:hypothetical protein
MQHIMMNPIVEAIAAVIDSQPVVVRNRQFSLRQGARLVDKLLEVTFTSNGFKLLVHFVSCLE